MRTAVKDQLESMRYTLDTWAQQYNGKAFIASDLNHMWKVAWQSSSQLRIICVYMGEVIRGDFKIAAATGRVDREFNVMLTRGKGFNQERGDSLTKQVGNEPPLFDLVEEARDILRSLVDISAEAPVDYKGIRTMQMGELILDAYIVEFSVATDLPSLADQPSNPAPPIGT